MKTIKFTKELSDLILSGEKTTTWRLFDDKDLVVGDELSFQITGTKDNFAKAVITDLKEKRLREVNLEDYTGHEEYNSTESMLKTYQGYYGDKVNLDSVVKIIKFKLVQ